MDSIYDELKKRFCDICASHDLLNENVTVDTRVLSTEEAIGHPEDNDFPLQTGKERLMEADFRGAKGQAYTDQFGPFKGTLKEIIEMPLPNNYRRAVLVATINAVLKHLGQVDGTIHCRDNEPIACAVKLHDYIQKRFGNVKIAQVGLQPRMVQALAKTFPLRVLDLDPDNIGQEKFGVRIEGEKTLKEALCWAELLLVTGTTLVNDTISSFLTEKPVIFYGTTISGAAHLMGWDRFCACSL